MGYTQPTPVQVAAMGPILAGRDVMAQAQTGSGKTAAFALPLMQSVASQPDPTHPHAQRRRSTRVLVLVPTRELAAQVGGVFRTIAQHVHEQSEQCDSRPIKVSTLVGGVSINPQMLALRGGAEVVVATPGRLLDLVSCNALQLGDLHTLVLDEADRMLDMGFADELHQVLALLPKRRQNLLFSATLPEQVQAMALEMLQDPVRIEIALVPNLAPEILQRVIGVDTSQRTQLLRHLVQTILVGDDTGNTDRRALVFVATQYAAQTVSDKLRKAKVLAAPFHGDMAQGARQQVLDDFKAGHWQVLVTTDLGARGLDVKGLGLVVNYDLPRSADDYLHRIGRTGRAGASGVAISFVSAASQAHMALIQKRHGLQVRQEVVAGFEPTDRPLHSSTASGPTGLDPRGGVKGLRPSKKDKLRAAALVTLDPAIPLHP